MTYLIFLKHAPHRFREIYGGEEETSPVCKNRTAPTTRHHKHRPFAEPSSVTSDLKRLWVLNLD